MTPPRPGIRVLIVDDEAPMLEHLARAARQRGYHAETAANGEEAWRALRRDPFDVVITDLKMPQLTGPELLARIERDRIATRVVVITGHATLDSAVECLRLGAADFLIKPFEVETFLSSVAKALTRPLPTGEPDWLDLSARYDLSPRQLEVLQTLVRTGKTYEELAEELSVSAHTVKSHIRSLFQKFGVTNRAQLLRKLRHPNDH